MQRRPSELQDFLDTMQKALSVSVLGQPARKMLSKTFSALREVGVVVSREGMQLPVCRHLSKACNPSDLSSPDLVAISLSFMALEPSLIWRHRGGPIVGASEGFQYGHANAVIIGPEGLEERSDVSIGVSLLAPNIRYPDHTHPPEETYLVMSNGAFSNASTPWIEPGIGGTFHNAPGVVHTMRSGDVPLMAFWVLWNGGKATGL